MKNQLKIGVLLSYVQMGLNMAVQLLYTPLMIRLLGKSEYGLYNLVGSVVSYLSLFSLGFTGAYLRFYSRIQKSGDSLAAARLNGMFLTLFVGMSAAAVICGGVLAQFTDQLFGTKLSALELQKAKILMYILVINISLTFPASLFNSIVSAHEKFLFQRILTLLSTIFNPLLCLPLLLMGYGSVAVVCVTTFLTVATLLCNLYYCIKKLGSQFYFHNFDKGLLREITVFSSFIFLNMLIDQINWSVDKYILGRVDGTDSVAVYGVGAQLNSMVISFSTAISSVFAPRINRIAVESERQRTSEFNDLFVRVGRIQFIVLGLIISGIVFFGRYFITDVYVGPEYEASYTVALLLILPAFIPLIQNIGLEIQRSMNKHKVRSVVYLFMAIINVFISIPFALKWGPAGSALGTAISMLAANGVFMNIYYHRVMKLNIPCFWNSILHASAGLIIPVLTASVVLRFWPVSSLGQFCVYVAVYTLIYGVSMYCFGCSQGEKAMLTKILKGFRRK